MPGGRDGDQGWALAEAGTGLGTFVLRVTPHHLEPKYETLALQQIVKFASERNDLVEVVFLMV